MAGWKKLLITGGVIVGVVIAVFVGTVFESLQDLEPGPQPDVVKAARSANAQTADQAVTAQVDGRINQVRAALPWATYLGTDVQDVCAAKLKPLGAIAKESWLPVTCTRTDTLFEAFDGDFAHRVTQAEAALAAAGWHTSLSAKRPEGSTGAEGWYAVPITRDFAAPPADPTNPTTNGSLEATKAPGLPTFDGEQAEHDRIVNDTSNAPPAFYYRHWQPYGPAEVAKAYPAHGAVMAITLSVSYGTGG